MKIYISNFNLDIIEDISELFKEYLVENKNYSEIYTDEHVYQFNNFNIYRLDAVDKKIEIYNKYYKEFNLIVDKSYFDKVLTKSVIGFTNCFFNIDELCYKLNKASNLKLIIKIKTHSDNTKKTYDIYFEYEKDIDINEYFFKQELIEFLSVFN